MPRSMIDKIRKKRALLEKGAVSVDDLQKTNYKRFEPSYDDVRPSSAPPDSRLPQVEQPEIDETEFARPIEEQEKQPDPVIPVEPVPDPVKPENPEIMDEITEPTPVVAPKLEKPKRKPPPRRTQPLRKRVEQPQQPKKKKERKEEKVRDDFEFKSNESQAFSEWILNGRSDDMHRIVPLLFGH